MRYGSVTRVKQRSGVEWDDLPAVDAADLDDMIESFLQTASGYIERHVARTFDAHTIIETYDGNGRRMITLRNFPVAELIHVVVNGQVLDPDKYRLMGVAGYTRDNSGIIERIDGGTFPTGWNNIEVKYTWGYVEPPRAVEDVAEEMAIDMLQSAVNAYKTGGLDSMNIEGFQTKFTDRRPLTEDQKDRLKPYMKAVFA